MRRTLKGRVAVAIAIGSLLAAIVPGVASAARPQGVLLLNATSVDAGDAHACGTVTGGGAFCWGDDTYLQLGNFDQTDALEPLPVDTDSQQNYLTDVVSLGAGESSSCAAMVDGTAWCWGAAMLGDGTNDPSVLPVRVVQDDDSALTGVVQVSVGGDVACALTDAGAAYCWGTGGTTGDGTNTDRYGAVRVRKGDGSPLTGVVAVSAGSDHACARTTAGAAWCWGRNMSGQLSDGSTKDRRSAVRVRSGAGQVTRVSSVSAGTGFTCLSRTDGSAWCAGDGYWGNLGNGTAENTTRMIPVTRRSGLPLVAQVSAGDSHACAVGRDGSAWCWGSNLKGELGNGTHKKSLVPVQVHRSAPKALGKVRSISAGNTFTCAHQGLPQAVWCWGANADGEVGDGTGEDAYYAKQVLFSYP